MADEVSEGSRTSRSCSFLQDTVNAFDICNFTVNETSTGTTWLFHLWQSRDDDRPCIVWSRAQRLALAREAAFRNLTVHVFAEPDSGVRGRDPGGHAVITILRRRAEAATFPRRQANDSHSSSGRITALALGADGRRLYAGSWAGVWRSDNGGESWAAADVAAAARRG